MAESIKLKPCPFCGGEVKFADYGNPREFEDWNIECTKCRVVLICPSKEEGCVTAKEEAAAAWNRRADNG